MKIEKGKRYLYTGDDRSSLKNGRTYEGIGDMCIISDSGNESYITEDFSHYFELFTEHSDPINPSHYKSYSVETIDMMIAIYGKEKVAIHCELTAFKYRQRLGKKDSLEQDLAKEKWYLDKAKELRNDTSVTKL